MLSTLAQFPVETPVDAVLQALVAWLEALGLPLGMLSNFAGEAIGLVVLVAIVRGQSFSHHRSRR